MSYTIKKLHTSPQFRELFGDRTLAEVLSDSEAQDIAQGKIVAMTPEGVLLTLRSRLTDGMTIELRAPDPSILAMFRGPSSKDDAR